MTSRTSTPILSCAGLKACRPPVSELGQHALGLARRFAEWLHGMHSKHEAPRQGSVPGRDQRVHRHIHRGSKAVVVIEHARTLSSADAMRGLTCSMLFGRIAATGLRISEVGGLDPADFNSGVLLLDSRVVQQLKLYGNERDRLLGHGLEAFFPTCEGQRPSDCGARCNFAHPRQQIGLREPKLLLRHDRRPRIHDLRRTFTMRAILSWYWSGKDVGREIIKRTTWLGRAKPAHTC